MSIFHREAPDNPACEPCWRSSPHSGSDRNRTERAGVRATATTRASIARTPSSCVTTGASSIRPGSRHRLDKPRVERAGGYSRASFFAGRTFPSLAVMRREAARWSVGRRWPAHPRHHWPEATRSLPCSRASCAPAVAAKALGAGALDHRQSACRLPPAGRTRALLGAISLRRLSTRRSSQPIDRRDLRWRRAGRHLPAAIPGSFDADGALPRTSPGVPACVAAGLLAKAETVGPAAPHQLVRELLVDHALHHLRQAQGVLRLVDRFGAERLEQFRAVSGNCSAPTASQRD